MYKLLAIDMDGTLLNSNKVISEGMIRKDLQRLEKDEFLQA